VPGLLEQFEVFFDSGGHRQGIAAKWVPPDLHRPAGATRSMMSARPP